MTDKEKYTALMQRYWDAETTPAEERRLARYVARVDDPDFEELRGVLGYLSIGRGKKARPVHFLPWAAVAAGIAAVVTIGLALGARNGDICIRYAYGEKSRDDQQIMATVESSLAGFFAGDSPAETTLKDMFQR